ncbi:TPA: NAD(P)H-dependent oxidoreductase [Streptococcus equi subsp. zooepidemicus]|uniref:NADPH-dependent FMN reductase n=1 Tax=Streptococcus equi TaxID=1336 RepID=UPI001E531916|nr:NADPH-dependent FMN reductase [Streptococcus equi]MCD3385873.1 NAD(P)H-dependent oxidoreductase [Streptococcus equi subsp. zooepidemicus]MCD3421177.1 NAD(P)H-dependent oxidoreductase [Streptococcus equi subsp. zooepidemicus]MCD3435083.1 NAD(P)H-dependent oxidoreductase [Streptococcus equi subsp. zooepidemicus]MCD3440080.1 NAD(P)H-dependent oxidoreductase [Streptococcus equi subsp. zooepidemicus]HEL1071020.1 NAD(P)H-dependent oxidoreductase [Streptococcus equi subsp. zooepidemicus]
MKQILIINGSLRTGSFNHQLAQAAEQLLEGKAAVSYLDWGQVPIFSQDLEASTPESVAGVREAIQAADAIWIFSPVYNFAIPGSIKNLLDWVSRALDLSDPSGPSAINGKVVTVSSVANGGHEQLFAQYQDLLPFIRTTVVGDFTKAAVNPEAWATGVLDISEETRQSLAAQAEALLEAIN